MSAYTQLERFYVDLPDNKFITTKEVRWYIGTPSGPPYIVPKGYVFDVSIPRIFWPIFSPVDPHFLKAACLHDHMLDAGWDRMTAGAIFHQALKADEVPAWKRIAMWLAVSLYKYED